MSKNKPIFDREYLLRFGFICLIALGLIALAWTYKFKSNLIIPLNGSNAELFKGKFSELADVSQYGEYKEMNISLMGQRMGYSQAIDRGGYGMPYSTFSHLPNIPADWGKSKFAYDNGDYRVFGSIPTEYFTQPEFFDDWQTIGVKYHQHATTGCKEGFFANPNTQRIYTKRGATIETYAILRASFCAPRAQSFAPKMYAAASGMTYDGLQFIQNPKVISDNIKLTFSPSSFILGKTYPDFDPDWAQKVKISVEVSDSLPRGLYVVSVVADQYSPLISGGRDIDTEAYKSKEGTPLANLILAVD